MAKHLVFKEAKYFYETPLGHIKELNMGVFVALLVFAAALIFIIKESGQARKEDRGKEEAAWNGISFSNNFMFFYAVILLILLLFGLGIGSTK